MHKKKLLNQWILLLDTLTDQNTSINEIKIMTRKKNLFNEGVKPPISGISVKYKHSFQKPSRAYICLHIIHYISNHYINGIPRWMYMMKRIPRQLSIVQ